MLLAKVGHWVLKSALRPPTSTKVLRDLRMKTMLAGGLCLLQWGTDAAAERELKMALLALDIGFMLMKATMTETMSSPRIGCS